MHKGLQLAAGTLLLASTIVATAGGAGAVSGSPPPPYSCAGSAAAPGLLAGPHAGDVIVTGVCVVNGGPALVGGNIVIGPGAALNATFARNDHAPAGVSSLTVNGNILVGDGAVLAIGCEPNHSPCSDDPTASMGSGGTLFGHNLVNGSISAANALAVIAHSTTVNGNVVQTGGGGGLSCAPPTTGIFALLQSPVFSDFEDATVMGNVTVTGLRTCWLGMLRNHVHGNVTDSGNVMGDPDAGEVLANVVYGSLACAGNSPTVQYGDSASDPNNVQGQATGECAFTAMSPDPAPSPGTPAGPLRPISVKI